MAEQENRKPKAVKAQKQNKYINKPIGVPEVHLKKYARGSLQFNTSKIKSKARRSKLEQTNENIKEAAINAAAAEILLPAEAGYIELDDANMKVFKLKQREIVENVDMNTAKNAFDLQLHDFAPYMVDYTRNGRHLLMGGRRGHIVTFDCHKLTLGTEIQLQEEINDVQYLHNETLFAVAQKNFTYIYDNKGVEIHCLKRHERPIKLDYLPYHFLLTSINRSGWIKWHDISTGEYVAGFQTGFGPCRVLKQNLTNAVMHVGHTNGVVSLWSPNAGKSLVSMLCHRSPITDLAIDREGKYMATTGLDGYLKVSYIILSHHYFPHPLW
jgi:U3 small nucleolar RNA-associated protein 7